jgi:hypothetical protein
VQTFAYPLLQEKIFCILDNQVEEEMLMCKPLQNYCTTEKYIFNLIDLHMADKGRS